MKHAAFLRSIPRGRCLSIALAVGWTACASALASAPPGLYAWDPVNLDIISIDTFTGTGSFFADGSEEQQSLSLASIPSTGLFYGLHTSGLDELLSFDGSGIATVIGPLRVDGVFHSLTYDPGAGVFYTVGRGANKRLYTIDPTTGTARGVGSSNTLAGLSAASIAFDAASGTLYMGEANNKSLYTIDIGTGEPTLVGPFGDIEDGLPNGLAFDQGTGTLYMGTNEDVLYEINTINGQATVIGPVGLDIGGMTFIANDCPADLDGDGDTDADDFFDYLDAFASDDLGVCDIDSDGDCDADDFFGYLDLFAQGC